MSRIRRSLLPFVFYTLLVFAVSSIPSLRAPGPDFASKDKIAHVVEYIVLGVFLFKGVGWSVSRSRGATFGFLLAVCVSVAAMDEIYQSFIPGRQMSILDWTADALGAAIGTGVYVFTGLGGRPPGAEARPVLRKREGDAA